MKYSLSLRWIQYEGLRKHLFPGDNLESAALVLCHRSLSEKEIKFVGFDIIPILNIDCNERSAVHVSWDTKKYFSPKHIEDMDKTGVSIFTIHSHPTGFSNFSDTDNENDKKLFSSIYHWFDDRRPHGSVIMLPDGNMFGRIFDENRNPVELSYIKISGSSIKLLIPEKKEKHINEKSEYGIKLRQAFGEGTYRLLRRIKVGVVGCSGTGSIVIEMLARNCVGNLVIVDPDKVQGKNLNRILNSKKIDADKKKAKVDIAQDMIRAMGFNTVIESYEENTYNLNAISALKNCDILFGCIDSSLGRYHLDCIASAYSIPYFDVGVQLCANSKGHISQAITAAHYICPGESSLLSRGVYTPEQVSAESMRDSDPERYKKELKEGYILNVTEEHPAVISINMQAACMGVNDFLARIHGYRLDDNNEFDIQRMSLTHGFYQHRKDDKGIHPFFSKDLGKADNSELVKLIQ